jgi:hypothetical protein
MSQSAKQSNAALQRLAHATTNKGYSPASPLQALVVLRPIGNYHGFTLPVSSKLASKL